MALTTLDNLKGYLGITSTTDDVLLGRMIESASDFVESVTDRTFALTSYNTVLDGIGGTRLLLPNYPIVSVSSLTIDGRSIPAAASSQGSGYLFNSFKLTLCGGQYAFCRGQSNVVVAYQAGYATIPADIEQATIEMISLRYKERDRIGMISKSIGGETVAYSQKDMPASASTVLKKYARVIPII